MAVEVWKPVVGFEGKYEVSNWGRVRSVERRVKHSRWGFSKRRGQMLRPGLASNDYFTVALGRGHSRTIHSLVAEAFIGPCPPGMEVLHGDGVRANSFLGNLRYGTRTENIADAVAHGTWMTPARIAHCKILRNYRGDSSPRF